jgi:Domain of unknown function (DUF397)
MDWRKSSYSADGGSNCAEAATAPGSVLVRDTTDRDGVTLAVPAHARRSFTAKIKAS